MTATIHRTEDELFASDAPETGPVAVCPSHGYVFAIAGDSEEWPRQGDRYPGIRTTSCWGCPYCTHAFGDVEADHVDSWWSEAIAA